MDEEGPIHSTNQIATAPFPFLHPIPLPTNILLELTDRPNE